MESPRRVGHGRSGVRGEGWVTTLPRGANRLDRETDDETPMEEIRADLESEFGQMRWPEPRGAVFHQSLCSDFELGRYTP